MQNEKCLICAHGILYPDGATRCDAPAQLQVQLFNACPFTPGHGHIYQLQYSSIVVEPLKKRVRRK